RAPAAVTELVDGLVRLENEKLLKHIAAGSDDERAVLDGALDAASEDAIVRRTTPCAVGGQDPDLSSGSQKGFEVLQGRVANMNFDLGADQTGRAGEDLIGVTDSVNLDVGSTAVLY